MFILCMYMFSGMYTEYFNPSLLRKTSRSETAENSDSRHSAGHALSF